MNEVMSVFILLTEILMILQCMQIVFKKDLPFDYYMVGIIAIDFIIYMGINMKKVPIVGSILFYLFTYLFCLVKFRQTKVQTVIRMIIAFSLAGCIEGFTVLITSLFRTANNEFLILMLSSSIAFVIAFILKINIASAKKNKDASKRGIVGIAVFYGISYASVIVEYYMNYRFVSLYIILILIFVIFIFFYVYRMEQARRIIDRKNYEIELQRVYGGAYEDLLSEIRKRQHDYNNQLGALYSMHMTANSLEELVTMQKEYGRELRLDSRYDAILTGCNNPIISGYLYSKCLNCEEKGVEVEYKISIEQLECCISFHEFIEILGILIDNACEEVIIRESTNKRIKLDIQENADGVILSVSNPAQYCSFSHIQNMFAEGYSNKGENRGLGLPRVKEIADRYALDIQVTNMMREEENWIEFKLEIKK